MGHNLFNVSRLYALLLIVVASILGWVSLVLLTDDPSSGVMVDSAQWWGLAFTICISAAVWVQNCLTIKTH